MLKVLAAACGIWLGVGAALAQEGAPSANPSVAERRSEIDGRAEATLQKLFETQPAVRSLYDKASGYAVFTATKAGFIVTGGGGTGVAVDKSTGARTYMRMGTGGIGLGIGAQRYDLVILFETDAHLDRFIRGGWDASTTAQAAAGTDGVTVTSSFVDGVAFYQLTDRGLMAQADVSGTRFWKIEELN
ncbi:MAG TPA: YSC84-related protein [Gammaproteobacteria bacterium]